ncbi:MAG TPA: preprotein translocase subunit SecE [Ignavibacteria bacterium]|nr:preprotein translocase subunit SecE [Ignavibacteria bacterium]
MIDKIKNFFIDTYKELNKVTWPKRKELLDSTKIVIITMFVFAGIVWVIDQGISKLMGLIFK